MEKIKKYIERFFKSTKMNIRYSISLEECKAIAESIRSKDEFDGLFAVGDAFEFGYVKGYRAAKAEMKKGGAA